MFSSCIDQFKGIDLIQTVERLLEAKNILEQQIKVLQESIRQIDESSKSNSSEDPGSSSVESATLDEVETRDEGSSEESPNRQEELETRRRMTSITIDPNISESTSHQHRTMNTSASDYGIVSSSKVECIEE